MANMSKHMIHSLGSSDSFGELSLKAKVLWPMLIAEADDQGRFDARPHVVKWRVCQNVEEITREDVADLLSEMVKARMVLVYGDDDRYGQIVKWWEYQQLSYARPSRLPPPDGWTDRLYYKDGDSMCKQGWDTKGGFVDADTTTPSGVPSDTTTCSPGGTPTPTPDDRGHSIKLDSDTLDSTSSIPAQEDFAQDWRAIKQQLLLIHEPTAIKQVFTHNAGIARVTAAEVVIRVGEGVLFQANRLKPRLAEAIGIACPEWAEREVVVEADG